MDKIIIKGQAFKNIKKDKQDKISVYLDKETQFEGTNQFENA